MLLRHRADDSSEYLQRRIAFGDRKYVTWPIVVVVVALLPAVVVGSSENSSPATQSEVRTASFNYTEEQPAGTVVGYLAVTSGVTYRL